MYGLIGETGMGGTMWVFGVGKEGILFLRKSGKGQGGFEWAFFFWFGGILKIREFWFFISVFFVCFPPFPFLHSLLPSSFPLFAPRKILEKKELGEGFGDGCF